MGADRFSVWAPGEAGSVLDAVHDQDVRCIVIDLGSLPTREEQSLVAAAVLSDLWRRRQERSPVLIVIRPRTVSLAGELADGVIIPGGQSPDDVRNSVHQFQVGRTGAGRTSAAPADVVVFVSVPADGPAAAAAATIGEYLRAGATHIAVNAAERDADLERFVGYLAHEVRPLVDESLGLS